VEPIFWIILMDMKIISFVRNVIYPNDVLVMAVSEDDLKEEGIIQEDFRKAEEIMERIRKKFDKGMMVDLEPILFTLC
jgi:hypothetical protein